jgi:hypothetical protein
MAADLTIRYSREQGALRSTGDLPGMLVIAAMPPDHPPGFAIDPTIEPDIPGRDLKARFDADLSGADWVGVEEVVDGLAGAEEANVLWKAMMATMEEAVRRALASFRLEEFAAYYELALRVAAALGEAGYGPR